jgi:hypothetical protein
MVETVHNDYEVSSEGAVRHWEIPYARLCHNTPMETNVNQVNGLLPGHELTGMVLTIDAVTSVAVMDFTAGMVYRNDIRNVLTYVAAPGGAEATWGLVNIGDPVYYDDSTTMPAGVYLSTAPANNAGAPVANPLYGFVVPANDADMALFLPAGRGIAIAPGSTLRLAIMQIGAGAA